MRIGILEADHVDPQLREVGGDYADMFDTLLSPQIPDLVLPRYDVVAGEPLPSVDRCDAWLITGSRHSVLDDDAWMLGLADFGRACVTSRTPIVGICFGHQLLAHALGGTVSRSDKGWGLGLHSARILESAPWMRPRADGFRILGFHRDQVIEAPQGARRLAASDHAPLAAFSLGTALGIQGHPEFTRAYFQALLDRRRTLVDEETAERAEATLTTTTDGALVAAWIAAFAQQRAE